MSPQTSSRWAAGRACACCWWTSLVDTGKTAKVVREIVPRAHLATVYAKPMGRPLVDTFITEVSQDTWIYFPWDTALAFRRRSARRACSRCRDAGF